MIFVTYDKADSVAVVTLDRQEQRNAINADMAAEFRKAMRAADADPEVRVIILAGAGSTFCAGMDLAAFAAGERPGLNTPDGFAHFVAAPRTKPVIAAVNGPAVAGGFELVLSCDLVVASETAVFGLPEVKRGIIAAGGGIFRLAALLPEVVANELILTGGVIDAQVALRYGLLNEVVPAAEVLAAAKGLASRIVANAPLAVTTSFRLSRVERLAREKALWHENGRAWTVVDGSDDALEGARAFKEKRTPHWSGQ